MSGALQTQGSCWFYGILNELILSYDLGRLLYKHIDIEFKKMTPEERTFFMDSVKAPCPLGTNFKKIYFYKFLDQYFCTSGPGQYLKKAGKSQSLVKRVSAGSTTRRLTKGSFPNVELPRILKTLGITCTYLTNPGAAPSTMKTELCAVAPGPRTWFDLTKKFEPFIAGGKYRLAAAAIAIQNKGHGGLHGGHALTATIDATGNGVLFDSASGKRLRVNWLKPELLKRVIDTHIAPEFDSFYKDGKVTITNYGYSHLIYVNKDAVRGVAPACRLNRMRRVTNNISFMYLPFFKTAESLTRRLDKDLQAGIITPADKQKIIKKFLETTDKSPKLKGNLSVVRNILKSNMSRASIQRYLNKHYTFSPQNKKEINKFLENKFKINSLAKAKGSINRLKTMKARKEYLKKTVLVGTNLANLKRYIAMKNKQQRSERDLKREGRSRSQRPKAVSKN